MRKKQLIAVIQRNFRKYMFFRDWQWYHLVNSTKRFIGQKKVSKTSWPSLRLKQ